MSALRKSSALPTSSNTSVYELRMVPADKVAQVVDDFLSEGPATIEKDLQPDGTFTIRVRRLGASEPARRK